MPTTIRVLTADDAATYRPLRLEALQADPTAFSSSYEEEAARTVEDIAARLTADYPNIASFGAFVDGVLVGTATLVANQRPKIRHRAMLVGMYVTPSARGAGLARGLLDAVVAHSRTLAGVEELVLAVTVGNEPARRLYLGAGFRSYAVEPRYLKIDGVYYDLEWMSRTL